MSYIEVNEAGCICTLIFNISIFQAFQVHPKITEMLRGMCDKKKIMNFLL